FFSDFNHTGKAFPFSIPSRYQFTQNILHSRKVAQNRQLKGCNHFLRINIKLNSAKNLIL
ncbi:hypothetical protein, partial [Limosilactobacillus fermentum]|uniref:hypothetical protein n=1 Tax=Limosilactobacillus fermentum TaxID=1613 RepID=UPI0021A93B42